MVKLEQSCSGGSSTVGSSSFLSSEGSAMVKLEWSCSGGSSTVGFTAFSSFCNLSLTRFRRLARVMAPVWGYYKGRNYEEDVQ